MNSTYPGPAGLPFPPIVLGVAGCSGSGKTTLVVELARTLGGLHFPLDHYYRDLDHLTFAERVRQNFDDPALIESPLLACHIAPWRAANRLSARCTILRHIRASRVEPRLCGRSGCSS